MSMFYVVKNLPNLTHGRKILIQTKGCRKKIIIITIMIVVFLVCYAYKFVKKVSFCQGFYIFPLS